MITTKFLYTSLFVLLVFSQCYYDLPGQRETCTTVRIKYDFPLRHSSGVVIDEMNDSFDIFYFDKFCVYKFPTIEQYLVSPDSSANKISPEYFVIKKGLSSGYFFDWEGRPVLYPVDSFLKQRAFYGLDIPSIVPGSFHEVREIAYGDTIIKYFLPRAEPGGEIPDTVKLYRSKKWKNVPFTLTRKLDLASELKTYRASLIFNSREYRNRGVPFKFPLMEVYIELKPIDNPNCEEAKKYVTKMKQLIQE